MIYDISWKGRAARWYEHPMTNRKGQPEGSAVVVLSTASVKPFPIAAAAAAAAGLALLGGLVTATILAGGAKHALTRLAADSDALAKGHYDTRVSLGGPAVVQHIGNNVKKLATLVASGAGAPAQVMVQEIVRAPVQEINESLAPTKSFERPDELEVESTQKVSAEVGNDYYDVVNVDADHVGVFVADAPVRGVRSSMLMASIRALFRASYKGQTSPAEVLRAVNRGFAVDLPRGSYVTAMYAVVNRTTGVCKIASAQHMPLVFWKLAKKASARLSCEGIALGLDAGPVFDKTIAEKAVQLDKGDRIVLFTDGAINAKNGAGAQYGEERFYYVVNREAPKNSAACVNFVANDVDLFHEGAPLMDDFTLVTVRKLR
jgi:serine phosphatase RsbU (regulator of sigma subunit)